MKYLNFEYLNWFGGLEFEFDGHKLKKTYVAS